MLIVDDPAAAAAVASAEALASRIGQSLKQATRGSDVVGRIGPLRFGIVAPATGAVGAQVLARRLLSHQANGDGAASPIRAGVCVVADFAGAGIEIPEMLERAATSPSAIPQRGYRAQPLSRPRVNTSNGTPRSQPLW